MIKSKIKIRIKNGKGEKSIKELYTSAAGSEEWGMSKQCRVFANEERPPSSYPKP